MSYLADTNLLVRLANRRDSFHAIVSQALDELHQKGKIIYITPQVLVEFRAVATRPITANGLGLSPAEVEVKAAEFETIFPLLEEIPVIFPHWKTLVAAAGVIGKQVHDARLVAVCHARGVTHLLTFNGVHFARLVGFSPGVEVIYPTDV